jgi:hypothetical protein
MKAFALALAFLVGSALAPAPARADFYRLDGRFQCLEGPAPGCAAGRETLHLPPVHPNKTEDAEYVAPSTVKTVKRVKFETGSYKTAGAHSRRVASVAEPRDEPSNDPLASIALAIKKRHVSSGQILTLRRLSAAGNAHASDLLAWCAYSGTGIARDPVAAYVLYGVAALAGVPDARRNQDVIFNYALSSGQRQTVLDIKNEVSAPN